MTKYIIDLDDTLISSTNLNNDSYNYALSKYGFPTLLETDRITRNKLSFIDEINKNKIIKAKQNYFMQPWIKYRAFVNKNLMSFIKKNQKSNCFLWTAANMQRAEYILSAFGLKDCFQDIIYDDKKNYKKSMKLLQSKTGESSLLIFENNPFLFDDKLFKICQKRDKLFNIYIYLYLVKKSCATGIVA